MLVRDVCENNRILSRSNPATMAKMLSYGLIRSYKKGELIFREREDVSQLYFLADGYAALFRINSNQDRKVVFVYGNHEMLNEVVLQEPIASISCVALSDVKVLIFSRKNFREMMEGDFCLTTAVMGSLSLKLRRCYRQLGNTPNTMCLDRQLASKLWKLGRDFGEDEDGKLRIGFEITVTFLADMLGAKRETVSRAVSRFRKARMIALQKNALYILDPEALRLYALNR